MTCFSTTNSHISFKSDDKGSSQFPNHNRIQLEKVNMPAMTLVDLLR